MWSCYCEFASKNLDSFPHVDHSMLAVCCAEAEGRHPASSPPHHVSRTANPELASECKLFVDTLLLIEITFDISYFF